ncbi:hypothetical protein [Bradyrhizobium sp. 21]|nr:hypothetical protein [Bradyrhizobium sp. 21]
MFAGRLAASLPCLDPEIARGMIDEARQTCLYSRALRRNIDVKVALI